MRIACCSRLCAAALLGAVSARRPAQPATLDEPADADGSHRRRIREARARHGQHDADYVDAYYGPTGVEGRGRGRQGGTRRHRRASGDAAGRPREGARRRRRDGRGCGSQYLERQLSALARARPHAQGRASVVRRGVEGALRRRRADLPGVALPGDPRPRSSKRFPGSGSAGRALRRVAARVRHPARQARRGLPDRHRGVPRTDAAARHAAGRRAVHRRVRHEQVVERLQLVPGRLPQPDPGQHRPADLHRPRDRSRLPRGLSRPSRLQRAAREAPGEGSRLDRVHGLPAVLAAVADRRRAPPTSASRSRFPGRSASTFERAVLFPAAGLDPAKAAEYYEVQALVDRLSYAGNEAARRYLERRDRRAPRRRPGSSATR